MANHACRERRIIDDMLVIARPFTLRKRYFYIKKKNIRQYKKTQVEIFFSGAWDELGLAWKLGA